MSCKNCKLSFHPLSCNGISVGDKVTVKNIVKETTTWGEDVVIEPGELFVVKSIAPKIRMVKGKDKDNKFCFIYATAINRKYGNDINKMEFRENFCNVVKV